MPGVLGTGVSLGASPGADAPPVDDGEAGEEPVAVVLGAHAHQVLEPAQAGQAVPLALPGGQALGVGRARGATPLIR